MKITNKIFTIFLMILPLYSSANVLEDLKDTPLSTYDFGKNQILTISNIINLFMMMSPENERITINVIEENNKLGINILEYEKASLITLKQCNKIFDTNDIDSSDEKKIDEFLSKVGINSESELTKVVTKFIWPNITDEQIDKIQSELFVRHTVIAKENKNFKVSCSKLFSEV